MTSYMDIEMWTERAEQRVRMIRLAWTLVFSAYGIAALAFMTGDRILWMATLAVAGGVFLTVAILPDVTPAELGEEGPQLLLVRGGAEQDDLAQAA